MLDLDGRVIMISGANRGIGLRIAEQAAADGAFVSLGARNLDALTDATSGLPGERVLRHLYDATEPGSEAAWLDATLRRYDRLDGLVNCAGILESFTLAEGDEAALDRMFEVNVKAPLRLTRLAMPHLRASGEGRVVNLSSLSGIRVANDELGYAISKFGVTALSQATKRAAWDDGVRYFDNAPFYGAGLAEIRMGEALKDKPRADYVISTKVGRLILDEVEDVSARDLQFGDRQWVRGKSLDTFCPLGPWIVTADELPNPQASAIVSRGARKPPCCWRVSRSQPVAPDRSPSASWASRSGSASRIALCRQPA